MALVLVLLAGAGTAFARGARETSASPVTLSVLLFERSIPGFKPDDSMQSKWIREQVKKSLGYDVKFVTMPPFPDVEKVHILMAAGQAPDITFLNDENAVMNYVENGGLNELGPLLDRYAPKLKKLQGTELWSYGAWNGHKWAVAAKRTLLARSTTFIRKDWMDRLGLPLPTTRDEWYQALQAFKANDPGATGGRVIPFEFQGAGMDGIDGNAGTLMQSFITAMSDEDRAVLGGSARWMQPGYRDGMRYLNKLYNEGLLGPGFLQDKDGTQYRKDVVQGLTGSMIQNWDDPYRASPGLQAELAAAVPGALYVPIDPFPDYQGRTTKPLQNPNGLYVFNPRFSRNGVAAVKYLEWMSNPDVYGFLTNGIRGVHYTDEVDGLPVNYVDQDRLPDSQKTHWLDFCPILNGREFGSNEKNAQAASLGPGYSPGYAEQLKQSYIYGMKDGEFPFHWQVTIEAEGKFGGILKQKSAEIWVKCISCRPEEFDALYDSMVKQWLFLGGQTVIDGKRAAYRATKSLR